MHPSARPSIDHYRHDSRASIDPLLPNSELEIRNLVRLSKHAPSFRGLASKDASPFLAGLCQTLAGKRNTSRRDLERLKHRIGLRTIDKETLGKPAMHFRLLLVLGSKESLELVERIERTRIVGSQLLGSLK